MLYAARQDKTITNLIEEWIDSLPDSENPDDLTAPKGATHS